MSGAAHQKGPALMGERSQGGGCLAEQRGQYLLVEGKLLSSSIGDAERVLVIANAQGCPCSAGCSCMGATKLFTCKNAAPTAMPLGRRRPLQCMQHRCHTTQLTTLVALHHITLIFTELKGPPETEIDAADN